MNRHFAALVVGLCASTCALAQEIKWKKIVLSDKFYAEGACAGDFNKDGKMDVASGPFWYEGPEFKTKHKIYEPTGKEAEGSWKADGQYSDNFLSYAYDFNGDGYVDYLVYGFPGKDARLYINPKGKDEAWVLHNIFPVVDNESPMFGDFDGDGKPDIVCHTSDPKLVPPGEADAKGKRKAYGRLGYVKADWSDATKPWTFVPCSDKREYFFKYTHGIGFGDINGDGKMDLIDARSWWENNGTDQFKEHPYPFGQGGAQMYVYDVDGDGLNDVITSLQAHGVGMAWFKQGPKNEKGDPTWTRNLILQDKYEPNKQGVKFSQIHGIDTADFNGDGLKDVVTGKRFFAHHSKGDVAPLDPAVLYWFELKRGADKSVDWVAHQIDADSGVGTQVMAADLNGDGKPDVIVGNKKGCFVFIQEK